MLFRSLRIGTALIQGLEGIINIIGRGGLSQHGRVRFPRYITSTNVIISYDEGLSEARLLLDILDNHAYSAENILMFEVIPNNKGKPGKSIIVTEKRVLLVNHARTIREMVNHSDIKYSQVSADKDKGYVLDITLHDGKKVTFDSTSEEKLRNCASYLPTIKTEPASVFKLI